MKKLTSGILTLVAATIFFNASINGAAPRKLEGAGVQQKSDQELERDKRETERLTTTVNNELQNGKPDSKNQEKLNKKIKNADSYFERAQKRLSELTTKEKAYAAAITLAIGMMAEYGIYREASYTARMFSAVTNSIAAYIPESVSNAASSASGYVKGKYNAASEYLSPYVSPIKNKMSQLHGRVAGWMPVTANTLNKEINTLGTDINKVGSNLSQNMSNVRNDMEMIKQNVDSAQQYIFNKQLAEQQALAAQQAALTEQ